jgi:hypothetical protein
VLSGEAESCAPWLNMENTMSKKAIKRLKELLETRADAAGAHC